jgi:hypothetical protein
MNDFNEHRLPDDLRHVGERLRDQRAEATALELDRIKLRAMARVKGARALTQSGKGHVMKSKLAGVLLVFGMLAGGTGAMAVTGTGPSILDVSASSSTNSQYCPAKPPGGGTPKSHPGSRCGSGPKP